MTWNRRDFLAASLAAMAGTVVAARGRPLAAFRGPTGAAAFREIRRNVGTFTSRGGTIGWLISNDGVLVVDSQYPDTAAHCLDGVRSRRAGGIDALVNTHHHADHTGGNAVFRDAARRIVAHERAAQLHRATAEAAGNADGGAFADTTFDAAWSATIGDETVHARHYGAAHTGGDCTVHFERANVVHMGDLVFNRAYPFIDLAGGASVQGWIALLESVAAHHDADAIFVFGHARPGAALTGGRDDILRQRDFLAAVLEHARLAVQAGRSRDDATAIATLPGFEDFDALSPRLDLGNAIGAAYDALAGS